MSQVVELARQLGFQIAMDPNARLDDNLFEQMANIQGENEFNNIQSQESNELTFAMIAKKLEMDSNKKLYIGETLNITDDSVIDSETFDKIYELQKEMETIELQSSRRRIRIKPKDGSVVINEEQNMNNVIDFGDKVCPISLLFHPDTPKKWDMNNKNPFPFDRLIYLICNGNKVCYFQKQETDNPEVPRCMITIILSQDLNIEIRLKPDTRSIGYKQKFYFFAAKTRIAPFVPNKDCIRATCSINVGTTKDNSFIELQDFVMELLQKVDSLPVPKSEINLSKDKTIWYKYVEALRKLVYQREQIWKIKAIADMPFSSKELGTEDDQLLEIQIEEKDFRRQLEKVISETYSREGLVDYGVNDKTGFVEFGGERDLSQGEKENLTQMISEYFYELNENSPRKVLSGEIKFLYNNENIRETIYPDIEKSLSEDYQLNVPIEPSGRILIAPRDERHVQKIIENKYSSVLFLERNNEVKHAVSFNELSGVDIDRTQIENKLLENNVDLSKVKFYIENQFLHIEVGKYLPKDAFIDLGFKFVKRSNTFYSREASLPLQPIDGFSIERNSYIMNDIEGRGQVGQILEQIKAVLHDDTFKIGHTRYVYQYVNEENIEALRSFKDDVDIKGKVEFNIRTSTLSINAENKQEHDAILDKIRRMSPEFIMEDAPYNPQYFLKLKGEAQLFREETIGKIQNAMRGKGYEHIKYDSYRHFETTAFTFEFKEQNERENFIADIKSICEPYLEYLNVIYENELGTTIYEFTKNDRIVEQKERELRNDIRQAYFKYYTEEEYQNLLKARKERGEYYDTREGVTIGSAVMKHKDTFTFKLNEDFLDLLDEKGANHLKSGYIRPIFPGELANINRMIRAMNKVTTPERDGFPANKNLTRFIFDPAATSQPVENLHDAKLRILENLNEPMLRQQPKQLDAVAKAMVAKDIAIIQGPPGTGKTTVIAEIIWQTLLINPQAKILITSQTNLAVDNALERLKGKRKVRPIRIGKMEKFEDEGKVYSDVRLRSWTEAKVGSDDEEYHKDNAIRAWMDSVEKRIPEDKKYEIPLKKWRTNIANNVDAVKKAFAKQYNNHINVFAATCSECGSSHFAELYNQMFSANADESSDPVFDLVIMDEASKATPPELVLPLTLGKKVVVIGDHKQLPPMIDENEFSEALAAIGATSLVEEWTKNEYKVSQFEKLFINAPAFAVSSLDTQFRMHEQIMNCISQFYADQKELEQGLICGIKETMDIPDLSVKASRWHGLDLQPFVEPRTHAIWVNVDSPEQQHKNSTSYYNEGEVNAIKIVLKALTKAQGFENYCNAFVKNEEREIGIITYYMSQMKAIRNALYPDLSKNQWKNFERFNTENEYKLPLRINTVDRFQGMERNIVIVSTVRSDKLLLDSGKIVPNVNYPSALGFAKELQRINVGFSRAKRLLIVIGNKDHFAHKIEYDTAISHMKVIDIHQLENL